MAANPPAIRKAAAANRSCASDLTQWGELRKGDTLTGTATVTPEPPSGAPAISGTTIAGKQILFRAAGGTPGEYTLRFSGGTSGGDPLADSVTLVVD